MSPAEVDETRQRLTQATWLLGLVARKMVEHPGGTAQLTLPTGLVRGVKDFVASQERGS